MKPKHVKSPKISVGCTVNFLKIICMMLKFVSSLQKKKSCRNGNKNPKTRKSVPKSEHYLIFELLCAIMRTQ